MDEPYRMSATALGIPPSTIRSWLKACSKWNTAANQALIRCGVDNHGNVDYRSPNTTANSAGMARSGEIITEPERHYYEMLMNGSIQHHLEVAERAQSARGGRYERRTQCDRMRIPLFGSPDVAIGARTLCHSEVVI